MCSLGSLLQLPLCCKGEAQDGQEEAGWYVGSSGVITMARRSLLSPLWLCDQARVALHVPHGERESMTRILIKSSIDYTVILLSFTTSVCYVHFKHYTCSVSMLTRVAPPTDTKMKAVSKCRGCDSFTLCSLLFGYEEQENTLDIEVSSSITKRR